MQIVISRLQPYEMIGKIQVKAALFNEEEGRPNDSAEISVFVPASDSIAAVTAAAVEKIRHFCTLLLDHGHVVPKIGM